MRTLTMLAAILLTAPVVAQPPSKDKTRMRLQLELELQKAKAAPVVTATDPAAKLFTDYHAALVFAAKSGKPLFVAVGCDCSSLCPSLRPAFVTCHVAALDGVPAGTCLLGMPTGAKVIQVSRWIGLPSDVQVKQQVETFRHAQAHQAAACLTWADGT